jgi:hypothetical protein
MNQETRPVKPEAQARRSVPRLILVCGFMVAVSCLPSGCMGFGNSRAPKPPANVELISGMPEPRQIVRYLNENAARVNALESRDLDMDIKAGNQAIGVHGSLYCLKPKNFRLRAKFVGRDVADIGSNDQEFWFWNSEDKPPDQYHCSYADFARGDVRLPFPFQPDWVLEALGMSAPAPVGTPEQEQALGRSLTVRKTSDSKYIELIEWTRSAQGQPVTKVTVLNNFNATGTTPQVHAYRLFDARSQLICQATVQSVQLDKASGVVVPHKIELNWPAQQLTMTMTLGEIAVNNPALAQNTRLFVRPPPPNGRAVDLARGLPVTTPTGIRRTGAYR